MMVEAGRRQEAVSPLVPQSVEEALAAMDSSVIILFRSLWTWFPQMNIPKIMFRPAGWPMRAVFQTEMITVLAREQPALTTAKREVSWIPGQVSTPVEITSKAAEEEDLRAVEVEVGAEAILSLAEAEALTQVEAEDSMVVGEEGLIAASGEDSIPGGMAWNRALTRAMIRAAGEEKVLIAVGEEAWTKVSAGAGVALQEEDQGLRQEEAKDSR